MNDHYAEQRRAWLQSLQDDEMQRRDYLERKRLEAIEWLRSEGRWVLQKGSPKPNWGVPG